jgi:hypothetical protein
MLEVIFIVYSLFSILYFLFLIRSLGDCHNIIESSKSRDLKNLARNEIFNARSDIVLCLVWPYLLYRDISLAIRALQSLK